MYSYQAVKDVFCINCQQYMRAISEDLFNIFQKSKVWGTSGKMRRSIAACLFRWWWFPTEPSYMNLWLIVISRFYFRYRALVYGMRALKNIFMVNRLNVCCCKNRFVFDIEGAVTFGNSIKNRTFDDHDLQGWLLSNYRSHRASNSTKSLGPSTKYKNDHVPECIHKWFHIWLSLCVLSSFPLFGFAACGIYIHICVYLEQQSHYIKHSTCNRSDKNGEFVDSGWKVE